MFSRHSRRSWVFAAAMMVASMSPSSAIAQSTAVGDPQPKDDPAASKAADMRPEAKAVQAITARKEIAPERDSPQKSDPTRAGDATRVLPRGSVREATLPKGRIVAIRESECDETAMMKGERPVIPGGATEVTAPEDVLNQDDGPLSILYPDVDTTTDAMYPMPCEGSIGGTLPAGTDAEPSPAEEEAAAFLDDFEQGEAAKLADERGHDIAEPSRLGQFTIAPCEITTRGASDFREVPCNSAEFLEDDQPFEGRDIIYVHGLAMEHLKKWLANSGAAKRSWPQDAAEFLDPNGYFRQYAENAWRDHIRENLFDPAASTNPIAGYEYVDGNAATYRIKKNRYLAVAWSSNQGLEYAQDAFLTQMMLAMTTGKNVVTPAGFPKNHTRPFCANGCIVITHSTGGEIVTSALGRAAEGDFGAGGKQLTQFVRSHVAFNSAMSGSRLASVAVALGVASHAPSAAAGSVLCPIEDALFDTTGTCSLDTSFVAHTILRDLMPVVAQNVWGPQISNSPVTTLTVAGGHVLGDYHGLTGFFLPGLDDGVVSMNSACGNPAKVYPGVVAPSGVTVANLAKAFDMGNFGPRSVKQFLANKNLRAPPPGGGFFAGGCIPWLSPMGMVMPVANDWSGSAYDTRRRYRNQYSMIQSSSDHAHDGGGTASNPWPSAINAPAGAQRRYLGAYGAANDEEMSAITTNAVYRRDSQGVYLVKPAFAGQMRQYTRGRKISFKLFGKRHTWWIWKRTYHLLNHYEDKSSANFVYEYVERR
jgi:hypothetical protein